MEIRFNIPEAVNLRLSVYNILAKQVAVILNKYIKP